MSLTECTSLLIGLSTANGLYHQERRDESPFPVNLELVLVFPRPSETYYPVYPFPVVFAISGASSIWPYGFNVAWALESTAGDDRSLESQWLVPAGDYTSGSLDPAAEPYYFISGSEVFVNSSATDWTLSWSVSIPQECYPLGDVGTYTQAGSMNFSTSLNGTLPNMTGDVFEATRIRFLDEMKTPKKTQGTIESKRCLVVDKKPLTGDFKQVHPGSKLEANVTSAMLEAAACPSNASWPDVENLQDGESCKEMYPNYEAEDSSGDKPTSTMVWVLWGALLGGIFLV